MIVLTAGGETLLRLLRADGRPPLVKPPIPPRPKP